jgi:hypothetical protein
MERAKVKQGRRRAKKLGELGELAFSLQAAMQGFTVALSCGDTEAYDFLVDNGRRCWRVQVKTTGPPQDGNLYYVNCGHRAAVARPTGDRTVPYGKGEIDFMVLYVFPEDTWYIVPWKALCGRLSLTIHSARSANRGNLAEYKGAWDLLWAGGKKEKARSGMMDSMARTEGLEEVVAEFMCEATGASRVEFRVWTSGEPPAPDAIARILNVLVAGDADDESRVVPVRAGEMGFA